MAWWKDRRLIGILALGFVIRALPLAIWPYLRCTRDECTYMELGEAWMNGEGMTSSHGWLWAPGYPFVLMLHGKVFGIVGPAAATQIPLAVASILMLTALARRTLRGEDEARVRDVSHLAALLMAASPTLAFYTINLWSETWYVALLLATLLVLDEARERIAGPLPPALAWAAGVGCLVGICALFRGIATYALPVYVLALVWGRLKETRAWMGAGALVLAAVLTVAPYSVHASKKFGGRVITDLTLGQMMWLGNNTFEPISFDLGNGVLTPGAMDEHTLGGRERCAPKTEVVARDRCETAAGIAWIKEHPREFVQRIPVRLAQLFTPHSILTRDLRTGRWPGSPRWLKEALIATNAGWTITVLWLGTFGLATRANGARGLLHGATVAYHVLPIALLAGLSRYRVPLEPILMIYTAWVLREPRQALGVLGESPWRTFLALFLLGLLIPLSLVHLPAAWPSWREW